ncbi:MAG: hypothetical protein ACXVGO_18725, partial [Mycobacterium sp.]
FLRRGRTAVRTEWRLLMMTHNITKLHRYQIATVGGWNRPHDSYNASQDAPLTNGADTSSRRHRLARPLGDSLAREEQSARDGC